MRIRVVDAFTDRPFSGNPAAVCLLDTEHWPDETWMQRVAAEMNHAETAFAHPLRADVAADWALRWFTPTVEVDLCGHATLATAHALHSDRGCPGTVRFRSRSGVLIAHTRGDGTITLDFPIATLDETGVPPGLADALAQALGAEPETVHSTGALGDLLTVLPDETAVRRLAPDLTALSRLGGIRGVITTAPADPGSGYDLVSRFFAPAVGIPEDPVTGSAHTALAPYWSKRLGRDRLTGLQASARTGLVGTALRGDRVELTGCAVTVLDGTLSHHAAG